MHKYSYNVTVIFLVLFINGCKNRQEVGQFPAEVIKEESKKANAFFDRSYDAAVNRDPERQTLLGIKKDYDKWTDHSDAFATREMEIAKEELDNLHKDIDIEKLDDQTRMSYRYFEYNAQQVIDNYPWRFHNYPANQMDGFQSSIPAFLINMHRIDNSGDAEAYISRLNGINKLFDQQIEGLKKRDSLKIIPPRFVFSQVMRDCRNIISGQPFDYNGRNSPLLEDFIAKINAVNSIDAGTKSKLIQNAKNALINSVKPAYSKLLAFLEAEEKKATDEDGAWKLPDGKKYYTHALKQTTTTDMTPDQIFETGEKEVARIHAEMHEIMKKVDFKSQSLSAFFKFIRTNPRFYFANTTQGKEAYKSEATNIINSMKNNLDRFFKTIPKADIEVKAVEPYREQSAGGAFYEDPSEDGKRPGRYYINLYNMNDQPIYQMESLAYHEGIPGHHMQVSIAQEIKDLPKFRKHGGNVAYVEGWALYAEYFPKEYGFYTDPYSDFGRLANEVFRAARMVVDVGIHYKQWSREAAIQYMVENTPNTENDSRKEIERYIVWPGQATGYKVGMLKIQQLRERAKKSLQSKFDIREFHDILLTNGPLPLLLLEDNINFWINDEIVKK